LADRTKLLVHIRRISSLFENAMRNGPDGTLEGKFRHEHPTFINHSVGFYLIGCLAYLEGEDGMYSWNRPSLANSDFDAFANSYPPPPKESFSSIGITKANLDALACIRNAVAHNNGDLAENKDINSLAKVNVANLSGVTLNGSVVTLKEELLGYVRLSTLAVRNYHGDW